LRVFVYRCPDPNSPKFAIRDLASGTVTEMDELWLSDAVFEVSPSGRLKSLYDRRKTVHAGIFGTLLDAPPRGSRCDAVVQYRPADSPYFFDDEYRPIHNARLVHMVSGRAYIPRAEHWL